MARLLFYLDGYKTDIWSRSFKAHAPDIDFCTYPDWGDGTEPDTYALAWEPPSGLLAQYPNIKAIFSIGAGVDHLLRDPDLPRQVPIIRMSDDGLKEGMAEYVTMATLALHRGLPALIDQGKTGTWKRIFSPAAASLRLGILGFGALGQVAAKALSPFGYELRAWSRSPKATADDAITHFHGAEALDDFLEGCAIVIGLLPETPETQGLLDSRRLGLLAQGAGVINAGRGSLVVLDDLIDALEEGHLSGAFLDVFETEPLAADHKAWRTPNLVITPHVAAITRPDTAARFVRDGIKTLAQGQQLPTRLDREAGY